MPSQATNLPHIHSGAMTQALAQLHSEGKALPVVKVLDRGPILDVMQASPGTLVCYRRGEKADQEGEYWNKPTPQQQFDGGRRFVAEAGVLPRGLYFEIFNEQMPGGNEIELAKRLNKSTMGAIAECFDRGYFPVTQNWSTGTPDLRVVPYFIESIIETVNKRGKVGVHPYGTRTPFAPDQLDILLLRWSKQILPALWAGGMPRTVRPVAWGTEFGVDFIWQYPMSSGAWKIMVERGWFTLTGPNSIFNLYTQMGDVLRRNGVEYNFAYDFYSVGGDVVGSDQEVYCFSKGRYKDISLSSWMDHWRTHISPALIIPGDEAPPTSGRATVIAVGGLRVRLDPASPTVIGVLPQNSVVDVISSQNGWSRLSLAAGGTILSPGASDPDPHVYVSTDFLRFL